MKNDDTKQSMSNAELELRRLELENRKRELELPVELASLGLRGTLSGAIAGIVLLAILAGISTFSERSQISGAHICILAGIICATVALYGAFVFQRSLTVTARRDEGVSVATGDQPADNGQREEGS